MESELFLEGVGKLERALAWWSPTGPPKSKGERDWLFAGKSPEGQTFILTINDIYTYADGQQQTGEYQVHVTIWNGVAYFYEDDCPG